MRRAVAALGVEVCGGVRGAVVVSRVNIHHEVSVAPKNALREDFYFHA